MPLWVLDPTLKRSCERWNEAQAEAVEKICGERRVCVGENTERSDVLCFSHLYVSATIHHTPPQRPTNSNIRKSLFLIQKQGRRGGTDQQASASIGNSQHPSVTLKGLTRLPLCFIIAGSSTMCSSSHRTLCTLPKSLP